MRLPKSSNVGTMHNTGKSISGARDVLICDAKLAIRVIVLLQSDPGIYIILLTFVPVLGGRIPKA